MESAADCRKVSRRPKAGLHDADDVQNQIQWHGERGNAAHGKDGHGCSGDSAGIDDTGERAESHSIDEVDDSQNLPEDEAFTMGGIG